jgi:phosphoenolpyruvate-protein kinase (PTS system EI component)
MSNHINEAALEQIAEEVMEMTVGDFLEELSFTNDRLNRNRAQEVEDIVYRLISNRFYLRSQ